MPGEQYLGPIVRSQILQHVGGAVEPLHLHVPGRHRLSRVVWPEVGLGGCRAEDGPQGPLDGQGSLPSEQPGRLEFFASSRTMLCSQEQDLNPLWQGSRDQRQFPSARWCGLQRQDAVPDATLHQLRCPPGQFQPQRAFAGRFQIVLGQPQVSSVG